MSGPQRIPIEKRFWPKVNKNGPIPQFKPELGRCWVWMAGKNEGGYGIIGRGGRGEGNILAHRFTYESVNGKISSELEIDHLCRNPSCVNPLHLEAVTPRVNRIVRGVGPAAVRSRQTHCIYGHSLSGENCRIRSNGTRRCQICFRRRTKEKKQRRRSRRLAFTYTGNL